MLKHTQSKMVAFTIKHTKRQPITCVMYVHPIVLRISMSWDYGLINSEQSSSRSNCLQEYKRGGIKQAENSIWPGLLYYLRKSQIEGDQTFQRLALSASPSWTFPICGVDLLLKPANNGNLNKNSKYTHNYIVLMELLIKRKSTYLERWCP